MRSRWAILAAALLLTFMTIPQAMATSRGYVVAQAEQGDAETQGEDGGGGSGQSGEEAETGTEESESEGAATETGPPWTYQMARIGIALMLLIGLAMGLLYYRMIASRQRAN